MLSTSIDAASKIKEELLPQELAHYPELQYIIEEKLIKCLSDGNTEEAIKIITAFNLPIDSSEIQSAAQVGLINELSQGVLIRCHHDSLNAANKIKDAFRLSEEFIKSPEVQSAAQKGFAGYLKAVKLIEPLKLKINLIYEAFMESPGLKSVEEGFIKCLGAYTNHSGQIGTQYTHDWKKLKKLKTI